MMFKRLYGKYQFRGCNNVGKANVLALLACAGIVIGVYLTICGIKKFHTPTHTNYSNLPSHDEIAGPPVLEANILDLKQTIITPHIEEKIDGKNNIVYCATFQIAWNEFCDYIGEDLHMENEHPMVTILNKKTVTKSDLHEADYVAAAGMVCEGIFEKIHKALEEKFGGQESPVVLPILESMPLDWIAYAYLFKHLPFQHKFDRLKKPIKFKNIEVQCFGIDYLNETYEVGPSRQVHIYDYKDPDDFIIELITKSKNDRLILAKVKSNPTLDETITIVQKRLARGKRDGMSPFESLKIPLLNFGLIREYSELCGKRLLIKNSDFKGSRVIAIALQHIRFRLDETGAVLKSDAGLGGGGPPKIKDLIFDQPFLVMIQKAGVSHPYFALWVDNTELLIPFD